MAVADCLQQRGQRSARGQPADDLPHGRRRLHAGLARPGGPRGARRCLADTTSRGSTAEEREAALAWLQQAARDEQQVAGVQTLRRRPPGPDQGRGVAPAATAALTAMATAPRQPRRSGSRRAPAAPSGRGAPASAAQVARHQKRLAVLRRRCEGLVARPRLWWSRPRWLGRCQRSDWRRSLRGDPY